ncbi:translesion DNA synthesis-associated protein ImuA [Steroidobacter agaridevorans]|uniref:translesion DNA synthesis-associated protein ImuA n=1 Tax=Steroidobacter agaridevorans TaxID=2695856 RepID=UPI0013796501|nr:translesion DNA synthesis-associated protein ImuA [Steroidobacter agaridevorans]
MSASRAERLEQLARLCRSGREGPPPRIEPSGSANLDAVLPGGGWQSGTIVELMPMSDGIGELRLLMPALAKITQGERHVAMIAPPYIPFAPALLRHGLRLEHFWIIRAQSAADILWSAEQTLRCKSFGAVLAWPSAIRDREVRRLQLAAEAGSSIGFVYRQPSAARESSPAAVRLRLQTDVTGQLSIDVVKCRGARAGMSVDIAPALA